MALGATGVGLLASCTHEGVAARALRLGLLLGMTAYTSSLRGHAMHGLLRRDESAFFLAQRRVALRAGNHALGRRIVVTNRAVFILFFMQFVIERHCIDERRLSTGLDRPHEQSEIGLAGFEPGHLLNFLDSGANGCVMASGAFNGTGRLLGLGDFRVTRQAFLVRLVLVFGEGEIALLRLVLSVTFGAIVLLPRCGKHHLGG